MNTDLYQYSLAQLAAHRGSWREIAEQCHVSYDWLCKFARDEIPGASYKRVKLIAEHMALRNRLDRQRVKALTANPASR